MQIIISKNNKMLGIIWPEHVLVWFTPQALLTEWDSNYNEHLLPLGSFVMFTVNFDL